MKLSLNWLKEYVDINASAEEIAEKLTMSGFEVEEIIRGENFSGVVVGKVLGVEKHPNADKLRIARVDVGSDVLQIVCGAENLAEGQTVPVAIVGAKLGDFEISKASLRGVDSYGMICSEKELGLGDDHGGIMVLESAQSIGEVFTSTKGTDTVLDVKVLANRPDCMGILGLAREVAALYNRKFVVPQFTNKTIKQKLELAINVKNQNLCPRYMARLVVGVKDGESPKWLKDRLISCGIRPIGLLVDISNYVMLEYGQPLHFFDYDKLKRKGNEIIIREANSNETITTLDGVSRKLDESVLVIADSKSPIAIAGVMGGLDTEIDKNTQNILIEAAVFDKASIRRTSRKLGLRSEAVARFEKGLSYTLPELAIARAVYLLAEYASGQICDSVVDIKNEPESVKKIEIVFSKLNDFLGTQINDKDIINTLNLLGFETKSSQNKCVVYVPWWRVDILEVVDIYEEVIRIIGYDTVPYTLPHSVKTLPITNKRLELISGLRNKLTNLGFFDTLTYSFVALKNLEKLGYASKDLYEIANPMVKDIAHLRPTLVASMLESLKSNQFLRSNIRLLEIGKTFKKNPKGKLPIETTELVLGIIGGETWPIDEPKAKEFYDLKGVVENIFSNNLDLNFAPNNLEFLVKGRQAKICIGKDEIGFIGEVSPVVLKQFDIEKTAGIVGLNLENILDLNTADKIFKQFSKYQFTNRDLSIMINESISTQNIVDAVRHASQLIKNVEIVDIYRNKKLGEEIKSVSVRMIIQSDTKTLTEKEIDGAFESAIKAVIKIGGNVRGVKE